MMKNRLRAMMLIAGICMGIVIACAGYAAMAEEPTQLEPGMYTIGVDIPSGWYRISRTGEKDATMFVYTGSALEIDSVPYTGHVWFGENNNANGSVSPLLDGCVLLVSCSEDGNVKDNYGSLLFEYLSPLGGAEEKAASVPNEAAFDAAVGIYRVGSVFPAGVYRVTCSPDSSWTTVSVYNEEGKLELSKVMHYDEGGEIGRVEIKEGYEVKVSNGAARFEPSRGGLTLVDGSD